MADWVAVGLSIVTVIISISAFVSGLPRLKIKASGPAIIIGAGPEWGSIPVGVTVRLTNDGCAAAHIDRVYLAGDGVAGEDDGRPAEFSGKIEARAGSARWQCEYNDLRAQSGESIRRDLRDPEAPAFVRATAHYGAKVKRTKPVQVNAPGDARARPPSDLSGYVGTCALGRDNSCISHPDLIEAASEVLVHCRDDATKPNGIEGDQVVVA